MLDWNQLTLPLRGLLPLGEIYFVVWALPDYVGGEDGEGGEEEGEEAVQEDVEEEGEE